MKSHGTWEKYSPNPHPEGAPETAIFWRNPAGVDWYALAHANPDDTVKVFVSDGRVNWVGKDLDQVMPIGELLELEEGDDVPEVADYFVEGKFTKVAPPPPYADPRTRTLTKRQVNAALILGKNITNPNGAVEFAISHIESPVARALALNDWQNAPFYARTHPLFNDAAMLAAMGFKASDVDDLWAYGLTLPA